MEELDRTVLEQAFDDLEDRMATEGELLVIEKREYDVVKAKYIEPDPMDQLYLFGEATNPRLMRGEE